AHPPSGHVRLPAARRGRESRQRILPCLARRVARESRSNPPSQESAAQAASLNFSTQSRRATQTGKAAKLASREKGARSQRRGNGLSGTFPRKEPHVENVRHGLLVQDPR